MITVTPSKTNKNIPSKGDILLCMTGYDASIAYWAIVEKVSKTRVSIRELNSIDYDWKTGGMDWTSKPDLNDKTGNVVSRSFRDNGGSYSVKRNEYSRYYKHSGNPVNCYNHH